MSKKKKKVIMHCGYGNIGIAALAAQEFVAGGYDQAVIELGGITFHIYHTQTGSIVVHENSQN